jgi:hypothetical protein
MNRHDLYAPVHKGVRAALVHAASLAGRTDFAEPAEAAAAVEAARTLVRQLASHADHEDREVMPVLQRIAPELHADLQAEHARTDGLAREALVTCERLDAAPAGERPSLGRRLHDQLWRLAAEHLRHMEREETQAMRALWAHCSDEELLGIHRRILASIPPAEMAAWSAVMIPALSLPERTAMLAPLATQLPRPALEALLAPVRQALGNDWARTAAAAGL